MAEIGLAASIITIAAAGTACATALYEAADVISHSNEQIYALAKHVTQSTAVLKQMAHVLREERDNCTKKVLRDIRSIRRSCKRTFREISSTVSSVNLRFIGPVKWLFKKPKTQELLVRLDSQQSLVQCVIQTLTVSKLGNMDSRSKQDSEHINDLKEEIKLLKTLMMDNFHNLSELKRAETSTDCAKYEDSDNNSEASEPESSASEPEDDVESGANEESGSDDDAKNSEKDVNDPLPMFKDVGRDPESDSKTLATQGQLYKPPSRSQHIKPTRQRDSDVLLEMVPYRPKFSSIVRSDRLIKGGQNTDGDTVRKTPGPSESIRLLLDKWTNAGSAPVSNILDEENFEEEKKSMQTPDHWTRGDHLRQSRSSSLNRRYNPAHIEPFAYGSRLPQHVPFMRHVHFWMEARPDVPLSSDHVGHDVLSMLRGSPGGIHYVKTNQYRQVHFIDYHPILTCWYAPLQLIGHRKDEFRSTEIVSGSISKEILDLLGYSYDSLDFGKLLIQGDLDFRQVEEIFMLSFQGLDRREREQSKALIKAEGWEEKVEDIRSATRVRHQDPTTHEPWAPYYAYSKDENPWVGDASGNFRGLPRKAPSFERYRHVSLSPPPSPPPRRSQPRRPSVLERYRDRTVDLSADDSASDTNAKDPTASVSRKPPTENRFTLLRKDSAGQQPEKAPGSAKRIEIKPETRDEVEILKQKLFKLTKKMEDAKRAKNLDLANDLYMYAIPEVQRQLEEMEGQLYRVECVHRYLNSVKNRQPEGKKQFPPGDPDDISDSFFKNQAPPTAPKLNEAPKPERGRYTTAEPRKPNNNAKGKKKKPPHQARVESEERQ